MHNFCHHWACKIAWHRPHVQRPWRLGIQFSQLGWRCHWILPRRWKSCRKAVHGGGLLVTVRLKLWWNWLRLELMFQRCHRVCWIQINWRLSTKVTSRPRTGWLEFWIPHPVRCGWKISSLPPDKMRSLKHLRLWLQCGLLSWLTRFLHCQRPMMQLMKHGWLTMMNG